MTRCSKKILPAVLATSLAALAVGAQTATPFGSLPLYFETNRGQADRSVQFLARGRDSEFLIAPAEAQIVLRKAAGGMATARMQFIGANPRALLRGAAELPGKINYLTGNDPARWQTGLPLFARVRVEEMYPGIGLVYYGNQQHLEYDFEVAPGANPDAIKIHFDGLDKITVTPRGGLVLSVSGGKIRQARPALYQIVNGVRQEIAGGYRLVDAHTVAFSVGSYDRARMLVIDPVLLYSTYFGGDSGDIAWAVKLDTNGFVYVAGQTFSSKFANNVPLSTPGVFQPDYQGGSLAGDAFVAKFDHLGQNLIYFTYLGGSANDRASSLAVDDLGHVYVAGYTDSTNFPTANALYPGISGKLIPQLGNYLVDAFVAELDGDGANLIYSTYLGGDAVDIANGIAVDASGNTFVTGVTYSTNFPTTPDAVQKQFQATNSAFSAFINANAFVTEIGAGGTSLVYSSFLGGTNYDVGTAIAIDHATNIYVTGYTASTNFPTANAIYQQIDQTNFAGTTNQVILTNLVNGFSLNGATTNGSGAFDAFVVKFARSFTNRVYSTLLGGTNNDLAYAIAADDSGAAYVTGWTVSTNFPDTVTITNLQNGLTNNLSFGFAVVTNVFLTQITWNGTNANIGYSAIFGGTGFAIDIGYGVALDPTGNVFVTGGTSATNFPTLNVPGYLHAANSGKSDAFVTAFNTNASALLYSTCLGGRDNDFGYGIAADTTNVYVVGQTLSSDFPTASALHSTRNGTNDAFLAAILLTVPLPILTIQPQSQTNSAGSFIQFSVNGTAFPPFFLQWWEGDTNFVGTRLVNTNNLSGATNATLAISNAQETNSGYYWFVVTNYGGATTSSIAHLLITNVPPGIDTNSGEPVSLTNGVGTTATFSVFATGTSPLSYQWQFNGSPLTNGLHIGARVSGATNATLTITDVQLASQGNYSVTVTNIAGVTNSVDAVLTVITAPQIIGQPTNQAVAVSANATFSVSAIGQTPLSYRWQTTNGVNLLNGGHFLGTTTSMLIVTNAQTTNAGAFQVVITNVAGSVTSSVVNLNVTNIPPMITVEPTNQTVGVGTNVNLVVLATGTAPLRYQWQFNGSSLTNGGNISGVATNKLTISNVTTNNAGNYSVIVTNFGGSVTSSIAVLTVQTAPIIVTQPTNQAVAVYSNAVFSVTAIGQVPLSYHWQTTNGVNLVNGGHFLGTTTSTLIVTNAQTTNASAFQVVITNVAGSVTSSVVNLSVTNVPPAIAVQPTDQAVPVTTNVTMSVVATGTTPLRYQWQLNGTNLANAGNLSGATTNVLKISSAQLTNSGGYSVIVTNFGGAVTSSIANLIVASSPVIVSQPTNLTTFTGATANFTVTATGTVPLHYLWQMDGTNLVNGGQISGATTGTLKFSNVQTNNTGTTFNVIITNSAGSVTSSIVVLTVTNVPPMITLQPADQAAGLGFNVTFMVQATGTSPLSYQWQMDGTNLVDDGVKFIGSTSNMLTISDVQLTNIAGSVTSSNAVLTLTNVPPLITLQPTNQTAGAGLKVTFVVLATGTTPLSYQWQMDGMNLEDGGQFEGATSNILTISDLQLTNGGTYTVTVTNVIGSVTSSNAVLSLTNVPPAITLQPTNQTASVGSDVTFVVLATGTSPLIYQWQMDGTNLEDGGPFNGAVSNVLTISDVQLTNGGTYTVVVTNIAGSVISSNAVLTVGSLGFANIVAAGDGSFVLSGIGGTLNGTYYVLMTTDLTQPFTNWTLIATNQFDSLGGFIFTNVAQTNVPQQFYILKVP